MRNKKTHVIQKNHSETTGDDGNLNEHRDATWAIISPNQTDSGLALVLEQKLPHDHCVKITKYLFVAFCLLYCFERNPLNF